MVIGASASPGAAFRKKENIVFNGWSAAHKGAALRASFPLRFKGYREGRGGVHRPPKACDAGRGKEEIIFREGEMTLKDYRHAPSQLLLDDQHYFFTGATYRKQPYLRTDHEKEIFRTCLFGFHEKYGWGLKEWSILNNHNHFLSKVPKGEEIPRMINALHKTSSHRIMKKLGMQVKPFWYQYWDHCIRTEVEYSRTALYILFNPVKHGLVERPEDYIHSSYRERFRAEGDALTIRLKECRVEDLKDYLEHDEF
jgi:putative transposase